jgi:D-alanine--D-alanine ligase
MQQRTRLLIVFGGRSSEHEISLRSATSILHAIDRSRFEVLLLGIRRDGAWCTGSIDAPLAQIIAAGAPVRDLPGLAPDLVFPVLHGPFGEDGTFQGLLEVLGLPYVGAGVLASALCMDKAVFKRLLGALDPPIPIAPYLELDAADPAQRADLPARVRDRLGYPCFVKPANQGSSVGITRVDAEADLARAVELAARYDPKLVIERGLSCREIELAVLGDGGPDTLVSEPGEIVLPPGQWYDYDNKYINDVATLQIPADLPPDRVVQLKQLALRAFRGAGCRGLARIDFFVDQRTLDPYLNELNTMPGFTSISMYPKMIAHAGVTYPELLTRLCELALAHHRARGALAITP